ncbi:MAG: hypothetical protein OEV51_02355 [Nitrospira sp.]|nr:hypothetical protein [Nitrospira sp.]
MGMKFINWMGFLMLLLAVIFKEIFLGVNAWNDLNPGVIVGIVAYLVVGASLSLWPSTKGQSA